MATIVNNSNKQTIEAVYALMKFEEKARKSKNLLLDETGDKIFLQFAFKKVPTAKNKRLKINLPHAIRNDIHDVCLFVKDEDKSNYKEDYDATVAKMKTLLNKNDVTGITEVMSLCQLRKEYKEFEAKRKLCEMFDVFLADAAIMKFLPNILGKAFFRTKKYPMQVNMKSKNLARELSSHLQTTMCTLSGGSSCSVQVANSKQCPNEIVANTLAAMENIATKIPGLEENVRCFHLKTSKSPALPLYYSFGTPDSIELPEKKKKTPVTFEDFEEVTTVSGKVYVTQDGWVHIANHPEDVKRKPWIKKKRGKKRKPEKKLKSDQKKVGNASNEEKTADSPSKKSKTENEHDSGEDAEGIAKVKSDRYFSMHSSESENGKEKNEKQPSSTTKESSSVTTGKRGKTLAKNI